ncbi:hypothetical protein ACWEFL_11600 [Streptomyces sp. NPDC004838]
MGPPAGGVPIYEQLVREWSTAGRTLPGATDLEWSRLVRFPPPQAGPPDHLTGSLHSHRGWLHINRHPA